MDPSAIPRGNFFLSVLLGEVFATLGLFWVTGAGPGLPMVLWGLAYAVSMALWGPWVQKSQQPGWWKVWTWAFPTLGLYVGLFWTSGISLAEAFAGYHAPFLGFLVCLSQGLFAAFWTGQTAGRARLFVLIDGVADGAALEDRVREIPETTDYTRENHRRLTASLAVLGSTSAVLASVSPYGREGLTPGLLVGFLALCLGVGVWLQTCRREREALTWGHRFTRSERTFPVVGVLILGVLAAAGSWLVTTLVGPLDLWIPGTWSSAFPNGPPPQGAYNLLKTSSAGGVFDWVNGIAFFLSSLFVEYMLLAIGLAALALAVFLIWPLVRLIYSGGWKDLGPLGWALVRAQFAGILKDLKSLFLRFRKKKHPSDGEAVSGAREWIRSLFGRAGKPGRRPYPEVVEAFLKLVKAADPAVIYRTGETTHQFLDRLAAVFPDQSDQVTAVRDLLDQELFGPRGLSRGERARFLGLVGTLDFALTN